MAVIAKVAAVLQGCWARSIDRSDADEIVAMGINGIAGSVYNRGN